MQGRNSSAEAGTHHAALAGVVGCTPQQKGLQRGAVVDGQLGVARQQATQLTPGGNRLARCVSKEWNTSHLGLVTPALPSKTDAPHASAAGPCLQRDDAHGAPALDSLLQQPP